MAAYYKLALTAGFVLAMAFTFSCSGDDGGGTPDTGISSSGDGGGGTPDTGISSSGDGGGSSSGGSSSSGGGSSSGGVACTAWGNWVETTLATCEEDGVETRTCTSGNSNSETRPKNKLEWGDWIITTPATCATAGLETATCSNGDSKTQPIAKLPYDNATLLCDARDGKLYKFKAIGTQTWMAENLNYDVPDNATDVCYQNNDDNCVTYGRLYNWATAMNNSASSSANPSEVQGVCPEGWHLPSDAEWDALLTAVGGSSTAGTKLKADSPLWNSNGKGTDEFGFSALPGGSGYSGSFGNVGDNGYWWSSTVDGASYAYYRNMSHSYAGVLRGNYDKTILFSVRCAQD
jgi:uncharacterized protein (TIGR02145 family)